MWDVNEFFIVQNDEQEMYIAQVKVGQVTICFQETRTWKPYKCDDENDSFTEHKKVDLLRCRLYWNA
jgi:hypothetical protein